MEYVIIIFGIFALVISTVIGIKLERNGFNNGFCPRCNKKLRNFDSDSQGGRGYSCDCGYCTWVSYKCVDKNFYNKMKEV